MKEWEPGNIGLLRGRKRFRTLEHPNNNNDNNNNLLQLGCHPVAVVILHVHKI